jgi:transposase
MSVTKTGNKDYVVMNGACNRARFESFVDRLPYPPGSVILLDNVSFHHPRKADMCDVFTRKGYVPLFTPPYSPQYNPIEGVFSVVKHAFRSLHGIELPGTVDDKIVAAVESIGGSVITRFFAGVDNVIASHLTRVETTDPNVDNSIKASL